MIGQQSEDVLSTVLVGEEISVMVRVLIEEEVEDEGHQSPRVGVGDPQVMAPVFFEGKSNNI